ncbi:MAG: 1,4-beta-glucanase, partial [Pseudomonadota bacterium]
MVEAFFPDYTSWADLTPAEWDMMSYRSMNTLGFVGYQFGEALLIDLGYYDDDFFYGAGAARNTWDGTWTGKNGVTSLEDFMTAEAQEIAIQEAFGFNLKVIEDGLGFAGESLDDYIGTTRSYVQNGQTVTVELTLTGIMAAAHLRGAWGTLALLEGGSVSTDEFGTSILRYIEQFGGYQAPSVAEAIALYEDRLTGDEGLGTPDGDTSPPTPPANDNTPPTPTEEVPQPAPADPGLGTAGVTAATADVVITWAWGTSPVVQGFDRASDTIFVSWVGADALEVSETAAGVVLAIPSNNQSNTLAGVTLASLSAANFTFLDATAAAEVLALVGAAPAAPDDTPPADDDDMPPMDDGDMPPTDDGDMDHGDMDHGDMPGMPHDHVMIGLDTPSRTVDGFDPMTGAIHLETGVTAARLEIFEESGDALGQTVRIQVLDDDGTPLSLTIITGIVLADLTLANFSIAEQSALNEVVSVLGTELATPDTGGFPVEYDSDGSAPPVITGTTPEGGNSWRVDANADDITGFDPAVDALDFGNISVHGLIATKTPLGEIALSSPWSPAIQIVQG